MYVLEAVDRILEMTAGGATTRKNGKPITYFERRKIVVYISIDSNNVVCSYKIQCYHDKVMFTLMNEFFRRGNKFVPIFSRMKKVHKQHPTTP